MSILVTGGAGFIWAQVVRTLLKGGMLSTPSDDDPAAAFRANAMGTFHVLESAKLFDVPQVLFSSTIGTYGLNITEEVVNNHP